MNFNQFVHEVTDIILALNKNKIYANFTIHVGRSKYVKNNRIFYC